MHNAIIYQFDGFVLDKGEHTIKRNNETIELEPKAFMILLLLVENAGKFVTREEIFSKVWGYTIQESNLDVQIRSIRKKLDPNNAYKYVETGTKAFKFVFPIKRIERSIEKTTFAILASISYGLLAGVLLLLEIAYQFDKYGRASLAFSMVIVVLSFATMYAALRAARLRLWKDFRHAFGAGALILVIGTLLACVPAAIVLPSEPITAARFPTQPAFMAFCKNAVIYSLPFYSVFSFLVYCLIYTNSAVTKHIGFPIAFIILWFAIFVFSTTSTNHLQSNLLTESDGSQYEYHYLFTSLLIARSALWFVPTAGFILWYLIHSIKQLTQSKDL